MTYPGPKIRPMLAYALMLPATCQAQPGPVVTLTDGRVAGVASLETEAFLGIPYARSPVGPLRWRPPRAARPWRGTRAAQHYGADCMQTPFAADAAPLRTIPSEDCLFLNVWRPATPHSGKLPVVVWLHGGGFVNGGSSPALYAGTPFARAGVIFVSLNYRLGRLGFFAFPALSASHRGEPKGNYGLMDQIAALRWVRRNIAAFGGDPAKVTLMGESAGGYAIHLLINAPSARGLFSRAIIESGGGRDTLLPPVRVQSAQALGLHLAASAGISGRGARALEALRALPARQVIGGYNLANLFAGDASDFSGIIRDGQLVRCSPEHHYASATFHPVPLIVGSNDGDLALGARPDDEMARQIAMDRAMTEPARFVARSFARAGAPAYLYRFAYAPGQGSAAHADDIPYAFGHGGAVGAAMHRYWINFIATGDPNDARLPLWNQAQNTLLQFTPDGSIIDGLDPWQDRLDRLTTQSKGAERCSD